MPDILWYILDDPASVMSTLNAKYKLPKVNFTLFAFHKPYISVFSRLMGTENIR